MAITDPQTSANGLTYHNTLAVQHCTVIIVTGNVPVAAGLRLVERLRRHVAVVANEDDDGITARTLYLPLWRPFAADDDPDETQGHFFQSVLIARPGYDDTPAEAAARLAAGREPGY